MPTVTLELTRWLSQTLGLGATGSTPTLEVPVGASVAELARWLARHGSRGWSALYDADRDALREGILVIVNGGIVDPSDRSGALLKEGDTLMFLSAFEGGCE